jgi:predicted secreted protein
MSIVRGKDAWLYWKYQGLWKPIACMQSWELTTSSDIGETSTLDSGTFKTFRWLKNSWNITVQGLQSFDTNYSVALLRQGQFAGREILIMATATDANGLTESYTGYVIVTEVGSGAAHNTAYNYSISAQGTGQLQITDDPFDPGTLTGGLLMQYPYTAVGDEYSTGPIPDLVGMWVPTLTRDGVDYRRIDEDAIFNDLGKDFKFDIATGEVFFNTNLFPLTAGEYVNIYYQEQ